MATMQHNIFGVREFIKGERATAVQRAFPLRFNILTVVFENLGPPLSNGMYGRSFKYHL
jgi:hypothetical protein